MTAETIVAPATAAGSGAIAVVRVSGPRSAELAERLFRAKRPLRERYATYGTVLDERGDAIDKGVAILARAPNSYTGEDTLELHVHGSPTIVGEVLRASIACGARLAAAGEFTRRAFLNGKLDLHAASAVADLIAAESRSAARAALANLGGGLANEVRALRARVATQLEELAGAIDFPDEVAEPDRARVRALIDDVADELERLLRNGEVGRLVREGVTVAIVGPPNAGKSSLLNALLGEERAIVSEIAGTTRDTIEETIAIDGIRVRLVDTAGIRAHADRLERAGIERTQRALDSARVALVVLDGSQPLDAEARALLKRTDDRLRVVFANKSDLGNVGARELVGNAGARQLAGDAAPRQLAGDAAPRQLASDAVCGSVNDRATLDALRAAIARVGWNGETPDAERPHLSAAREFDAVRDALEAFSHARETLAAGEAIDFAASDLARAHQSLGHVSGDTATEELLDGIFARFCIGK